MLVLIDTARTFYDSTQFGNPKVNLNSNGYEINQILTLIILGLYGIDWIIQIIACDSVFKSKKLFFDFSIIILYISVVVVEYTIPDYENQAILRLLRGFRILHLFKVIPLIPSLHVVVEALLSTIKSNILSTKLCLKS